MQSLLLACYRALRPRRRPVVVLSAVLLCVCAVLTMRLSVREDVRALLPSHSADFSQRFLFLQQAPLMRMLSLTVSGDGPPKELAEAVAAHLRGPDIPSVSTGPGTAFAPGILTTLARYAPALMRPDDIASLASTITPEYMRERLRQDRKQLLSPQGLALREITAVDPLHLRGLVWKNLKTLATGGSFSLKDGAFTDATGRYGLVLARPSLSMTDSRAAAQIMDQARQALKAVPGITESFITGSYAHSEANAAVIKSDLNRVLPLSTLLLIGLFLLLCRDRAALFILAVPLAALVVAGAVTGGLLGGISGIVLGFGGVLLGITVDYSIHVYYAVSNAPTPEKGLASVSGPLLAGICTTAAAFASLAFSSIPVIRQLSLFGLTGVFAAACCALFVLSLLLRARGEQEPSCPHHGPHHKAAGRRKSVALLPPAALAALLGLVILFCFSTMKFDGDIRNISYRSPEVLEAERASRAIWHTSDNGAFIVAAGDGSEAGLEQALRVNDAVADIMSGRGIASSSLAPLLPSRQRQEKSLEAWRAFRDLEREELLSGLESEARAQGFSQGAFAPFAEWLRAEAALVTPEILRALGAGFFLDMHLTRDAEHSLLYTMLPDATALDEAARKDIETVGAHVVSGEAFRADLGRAAAKDISRFCLITLLVTCGVVCLLYRNAATCLSVLTPMLTALALTLLLFRLTDTPLNMFHAVALPLVIALTVDYGIFMQAVLDGSLEATGKKAVLLSALTTLAGFGSLLAARHPALFSLGLIVSTSCLAALATALWVQPRLWAASRGPRK